MVDTGTLYGYAIGGTVALGVGYTLFPEFFKQSFAYAKDYLAARQDYSKGAQLSKSIK